MYESAKRWYLAYASFRLTVFDVKTNQEYKNTPKVNHFIFILTNPLILDKILIILTSFKQLFDITIVNSLPFAVKFSI